MPPEAQRPSDHTDSFREAHELQATLAESIETKASPGSLLEQRHFVEQAPTLESQVTNNTRTTQFTYAASESGLRLAHYGDTPLTTTTEQTGLQGLTEFLHEVASRPDSDEQDRTEAQDILDNLTFIGEPEYQAAAAGLATSWKERLDANPYQQLVILADIQSAYAHAAEPVGKSDEFLRQAILANFTPEERERYAGRLITSPTDITQTPENVHIILVDDWTISGTQLLKARDELAARPELADYKDRIEANLVVAADQYVQSGINYEDAPPPLPVKAYYRARSANTQYGARITGLHSSVDYGFEDSISRMVTNRQARGEAVTMPPLTNVIRPYRDYTKGSEPVAPIKPVIDI